MAKKVAEKKKEQEEFLVRIDRMRIEKSTLGFKDTNANPTYRVFVQDMRAEVENYSNGFRNGNAHIRLKGKFMGSGRTCPLWDFPPRGKGGGFRYQSRDRGYRDAGHE